MSGRDPGASGGFAVDGRSPTSPAPAGSNGDSGAADAPAETVSPEAGADIDRRRFFRQFATDIVHTAATVVGAATVLQRSSAEAASAILRGPAAQTEDEASSGASPPAAQVATTAPPAGAFGQPIAAVGYHSAFRVDRDHIILTDQRRLPFALVEVECRTAIDVAHEIAERTVGGSLAAAQVSAVGLALSANRVRTSRPYARRAIMRAAETTLLQARPTSRPLRAAVERVMARYVAIGEFDEDGDAIADAMQREAEAVVFEANEDHGRLAEAAATRIPGYAERLTGILTLGSTGAIGCGQFGTALGAVQAAGYTGRPVHVYVLEGRPNLDGARVAAWELAQAGIAHTLVTDAAAGWLVQAGRIDVVLVGAEAIALNGDVANETGTYAVAALAGRHDVPVIVCAPLAALDPAAPDGRGLVNSERPPQEVTKLGQVPIASAETAVLNPVVDVTPAGLVTAFATEEGLLEAPFGQAFERALASRARRLPTSAGATVIPVAVAPGSMQGRA